MNNGPLIFLGIFCAIAASWVGIVLANLIQQTDAGATQPYYSEIDGKAFPQPLPGAARQGAQVYQDLGCMYCHSQQVRSEKFGSDIARNWGTRQSVSRDYIYDGRVMLGTMRTGPDLRNVGQRLPDAGWHYLHLYNPVITSSDPETGAQSLMPPHPFLFETRKIVGEKSSKALNLTGEFAPEAGYEVVPTPRAEALVAYLLSLKTPYDLPEAMSGGAE